MVILQLLLSIKLNWIRQTEKGGKGMEFEKKKVFMMEIFRWGQVLCNLPVGLATAANNVSWVLCICNCGILDGKSHGIYEERDSTFLLFMKSSPEGLGVWVSFHHGPGEWLGDLLPFLVLSVKLWKLYWWGFWFFVFVCLFVLFLKKDAWFCQRKCRQLGKKKSWHFCLAFRTIESASSSKE